MGKQIRNFVFTCNNWSQDDVDRLVQLVVQFKCNYYIYGEETGEKEGTAHLQGYVELESRVVFDKIRKHLCGFHLEPRLGSQQQAIEYCKKQGTYHEYGVPKLQGHRTDIDSIKSVLKSNSSLAALLENEDLHLNSQTFRLAERLVKYYDKPRHHKPTVIWFYGASGIGKTRRAVELLPDAYFKSNSTGKWWTNYDGHDDVIIDDVRKETYPFTYLLGLLDRYPFQVEDKGSLRQFCARRIIITSPLSPYDQYNIDGEDILQLVRRIDLIEEVT